MNAFGLLDNELRHNSFMLFNNINFRDDITIGYFLCDDPVDHLVVYNSPYIDMDSSLESCPTKMIRLSILENKILDIYADDSIPKKWIFTDQEKEIIFKTIREHWEIIIRKIKYLQKDNGLQYPKYSPY